MLKCRVPRVACEVSHKFNCVMSRTDRPELFDALIIGGGPAGLAAAYYLARFRRRTLVIDGGDSRAAWAPMSHNHAGFPEGIRGVELLRRMRLQARAYGAELETGTIDGLQASPEGFIAASSQCRYRTRTLLLATGVVDVKPDLPNLAEAVLQGLIRYCPVCDAYEAIDKRLLVLGHGAGGFGEAEFLRTYSRAIAVTTLGAPFDRRDGRYRSLLDAGVRVLEHAMTGLRADPAGGSISAIFADGSTLSCDVVYAALGYRPRNGLAKTLGAETAADQRLEVNDHQETTVPNCFAAGDIVHGLNQISVAIGQAAVAAVTMHNRLREMR